MNWFNKQNLTLPERSLDEIKNICKITFVDDKKFPIVDIIKNEGWKNVILLKDIESLEQTEIKEAHIIMMDIQGVGKKLNLKTEGVGLIEALKTKYKETKTVIAYSGEESGIISAFTKGIDLADTKLRKDADTYEFIFTIDKYAKRMFDKDSCIKRVQEMLEKELGIKISKAEISDNLLEIYKRGDYSEGKVSKVFNIQNLSIASNLAQILQLYFTVNS